MVDAVTALAHRAESLRETVTLEGIPEYAHATAGRLSLVTMEGGARPLDVAAINDAKYVGD